MVFVMDMSICRDSDIGGPRMTRSVTEAAEAVRIPVSGQREVESRFSEPFSLLHVTLPSPSLCSTPGRKAKRKGRC